MCPGAESFQSPARPLVGPQPTGHPARTWARASLPDHLLLLHQRQELPPLVVAQLLVVDVHTHDERGGVFWGEAKRGRSEPTALKSEKPEVQQAGWEQVKGPNLTRDQPEPEDTAT